MGEENLNWGRWIGRTYTTEDETRRELLQGRRYLATWNNKQRRFVVNIYSSIALLVEIKEPPRGVIVKAEVQSPGQRHPHVWAGKNLAADAQVLDTLGLFCYLLKPHW